MLTGLTQSYASTPATVALTDSVTVAKLVQVVEELELELKLQAIDCEAQAYADSIQIAVMADRRRKAEPNRFNQIVNDSRLWFFVGAIAGMQSRRW